jgi:hypothetical protein
LPATGDQTFKAIHARDARHPIRGANNAPVYICKFERY